jgi:hypothetical protein
MLTYAGREEEICKGGEELTYADVCWRMLTYADVCWKRGGEVQRRRGADDSRRRGREEERERKQATAAAQQPQRNSLVPYCAAVVMFAQVR